MPDSALFIREVGMSVTRVLNSPPLVGSPLGAKLLVGDLTLEVSNLGVLSGVDAAGLGAGAAAGVGLGAGAAPVRGALPVLAGVGVGVGVGLGVTAGVGVVPGVRPLLPCPPPAPLGMLGRAEPLLFTRAAAFAAA